MIDKNLACILNLAHLHCTQKCSKSLPIPLHDASCLREVNHVSKSLVDVREDGSLILLISSALLRT